MNPNSLKAFGYLVLVLSPLGAVVTQLFRTYDFSVPQPMPALVAFAATFVVGVGLIGLRKWAPIYFSVPLLCVGVWIFWTSMRAIKPVPFPANLIFMLEGVSLMLPAVVTVRLWPYLSWRGNWFF